VEEKESRIEIAQERRRKKSLGEKTRKQNTLWLEWKSTFPI
jgi:hypothetical protein